MIELGIQNNEGKNLKKERNEYEMETKGRLKEKVGFGFSQQAC